MKPFTRANTQLLSEIRHVLMTPILRTSDPSTLVFVYVYDITKGLSNVLSPILFGSKITSIYHTSVVVFDTEYFYSSRGIIACRPGTSVLEAPDSKIAYGRFSLNRIAITDWLAQAKTSTFSAENYSLLEHNCNTFSELFLYRLLGASLPDAIKYQIADISNTPFGNIWIKLLRSKSVPNVSLFSRGFNLS